MITTVVELRALAKEQGLKGYFTSISLLEKSSSQPASPVAPKIVQSKDIVKEAEKEHQQEEETEKENQEGGRGDIDLIPKEHIHALNRAYRSFRSPGLPKTDVDIIYREDHATHEGVN